jgi:hypothetical protein
MTGATASATVVTASIALAACSGPGSPPPGAAPAAPTSSQPALPAPPATWATYRHLDGVVDLAGPRHDGSFVVAANGRLLAMNAGGVLSPFARGAVGYQTATGTEPYLVTAGGCFGNGAAFAIDPAARPGVIEITLAGQARRFASLPAGRGLSGIAYDATGRFGHRLLVTAEMDGKTTVFGIGCDARVSVVAGGAPPMEGGIAVAPASFGSFGGDMIAPNETSGRIYAVSSSGAVVTLAHSGLPAGGDIGVESAGFVPAGASAAYLADRYSPGNMHPGDNVILRLSAAELARAGIRAGDLLVATEGGARTVDVRCAAACTVRYVAAGPAIAHGEGHIAFAS